MNTQNISFVGCIPMEFYAKYQKTGTYVPIVKPENVRKCQNFVVRNLNNTAGSNQNDKFVREYKKIDKDYAKVQNARSVYDKDAPIIKTINEELPFYSYLITGKDADELNDMGQQLGYRKKEIYDKTGSKNNSEVKKANRNYKYKIKNFIYNLCKRVKDENQNELIMQVYFTPKLNKKGEVTKFNYDKVTFYPQKEI